MKKSTQIIAFVAVGALVATLFTFLIGPSLLSPQQPLPRELILYNGKVLTMEAGRPEAEAIAVEGERITAVGTDEEVLALRTDRTVAVDLAGRTLLPGFIDSHAHWIGDRALVGHETAGEAIEAALEEGWTSVSELFVNEERLRGLRQLDESGDLRLRVNAYLPLSWRSDRFGDWYRAYQPGQEFSSRLRVAGVKVFVDNGPGIGYEDRNYWFAQAELDELLMEADDAGFQIAVHAIVDSAIDTVLNSYEQILRDRPGMERRHRVEHAVMLRDDQLTRMRDLGVVASIQLSWFNSDWTEEILRDPGPEKAPWVGRWRDLLDENVRVIGGTDHPWTMFGTVGGSMKAIYQAVTRIGEMGRPPPSWMLDQRISVEQALSLITIDAAYGTFQEGVKGSIVVGKLADLVVLSENPLAIPPERIQDVEVLLTVVGGRAEHCVDYTFLCAQSVTSGRGPLAAFAEGAIFHAQPAAASADAGQASYWGKSMRLRPAGSWIW